MAVLLLLLALGMIATGGAAVVFGAPIVQIERGWTMVISGTVAASSGAVLVGIALAVQRLGRIARETVTVRDRLAQMEELAAMRSADRPVVPAAMPVVDAGPVAPPEAAIPPTPPRPPQPPADQVTVVGQYASGGNSYTMFSDGSIRAETPAGERRFGSLDELRNFVAAGGEKFA